MGPSLELAFRMGKQKRSISHPLCSVEPTRLRLLFSATREVPSIWPFPPPGIKGTVGFALLISRPAWVERTRSSSYLNLHLLERIWPLGACGGVRFLYKEGVES